MSYKKAVVFFIDILGIKNISDFETLYKINNTFHNSLEDYQDKDLPHTAYNRTVHTFSDCAYIIYDFKDNIDDNRKNIAKLMKVALYNTESLINNFLLNGFICRGGVTYGDLFYEKERSLFFGPAINNAYLLESKKALYPRILVDDVIVEYVNQLESDMLADAISNNLSSFLINNYKLVNGEIIKKDKDNLYHLNYFNKLKQGHYSIKNDTLIDSVKNIINSSMHDIQNQLEQIIDEQLINELNRIIKKYQWLEEFFNESIPSETSNIVIF